MDLTLDYTIEIPKYTKEERNNYSYLWNLMIDSCIYVKDKYTTGWADVYTVRFKNTENIDKFIIHGKNR